MKTNPLHWLLHNITLIQTFVEGDKRKRHPNGCRLPVKEMKYSLGPKADCNQANLTDERSWLNLLIPSSIFFTVFGDGCL